MIEAENASFTYQSAPSPALQDVTLTVQPACEPAEMHPSDAGDNSFYLEIYRLQDDSWLISLNLSDPLREILQDYPRIHLQLLDEEGQEWLCQRFDNQSRFNARWQGDTDPNERLCQVSLSLNLV